MCVCVPIVHSVHKELFSTVCVQAVVNCTFFVTQIVSVYYTKNPALRSARDDRYDALVQKDRSHRRSIRYLMFDSCLLFVSPDSDLCIVKLRYGRWSSAGWAEPYIALHSYMLTTQCMV